MGRVPCQKSTPADLVIEKMGQQILHAKDWERCTQPCVLCAL